MKALALILCSLAIASSTTVTANPEIGKDYYVSSTIGKGRLGGYL